MSVVIGHAHLAGVGQELRRECGTDRAEGEPEVVTRDSRVIEAYLGKKWVAHAPH